MLKKSLIAGVLILVLVHIGDYVIHQVILSGAYVDTARLWRPMEEMKMGLMEAVYVLSIIPFVAVYHRLIKEKSTAKGIEYGCWYGFAGGVGMGYGFYCVSPIPYSMAFTWFMGTWIEMVLAGLLLGLIVKQSRTGPAEQAA